MQGRRRVVLVVEQDRELRDRMGGWLEADGHEVLACPGPSHPDYTCVVGRGSPCTLADAADVVVLDLWLASDRMLLGTSSKQLLRYYVSTGRPVVALAERRHHDSLLKGFLDEAILFLEWPPDPHDLCETVRTALRDLPPIFGPSSPAKRDKGLSSQA